MLTKRKVKVLIASGTRSDSDLPENQLQGSEVFHFLFSNSANFSLLAEIEDFEADLVVLLGDSDVLPGIVSQIFDEYPGLIVVVFNQADGEAVICKQSITTERLRSQSLIELLQRVSGGEKCEYWGTSN